MADYKTPIPDQKRIKTFIHDIHKCSIFSKNEILIEVL